MEIAIKVLQNFFQIIWNEKRIPEGQEFNLIVPTHKNGRVQGLNQFTRKILKPILEPYLLGKKNEEEDHRS